MPKGLIALGVFIAALVALVLLVWPAFQDYRSALADKSDKQEQLKQREQYFDKLSRVADRLQDDKAALAKIDSALPDKPDTDRVIHFLSSTAEDRGVILNEIANIAVAEGSDENNELRRLSVTARLAGNYPAFKDFISAVEGSARLIEVSKISFAPLTTLQEGESGGGTLSFEVDFIMHTY